MNDLPISLTFDDVLLVPAFSSIEHRSTVDISNNLGSINCKIPLISSPMDTVTGDKMALKMQEHGGVGVIHRRATIENQCKMVKSALISGSTRLGAAIGSTGDFLERAQALISAGASIICLDVAHGDHELVRKALEKLNSLADRGNFHIMAGNVATGDAFVRLAQWGADSIRAGIGGGSICSTRLNTGFGVPNLAVILDCNKVWGKYTESNTSTVKKPALIIDGGIRNAGDIVKALAAGADFAMCGSLFAGTDEAPGEIILDNNGNRFKTFRGMACYSDDTELLTENGWKLFVDLSDGESVATLNPVNNKIEYHIPVRKMSYDYCGTMIHFETEFTDILVTPNHRMYLAKKSNIISGHREKYDFIEAQACFGQSFIAKHNMLWSGKIRDIFTIPGAGRTFDTFISKESIRERPYDAKVHCVEVQNNILYVRRNGKPAWCGNSRESQMDFGGVSSAPEGISVTIKYKGHITPIVNDLVGNIKSGLSYCGATNIPELRRNAQFIRQSNAGMNESFTHILKTI